MIFFFIVCRPVKGFVWAYVPKICFVLNDGSILSYIFVFSCRPWTFLPGYFYCSCLKRMHSGRTMCLFSWKLHLMNDNFMVQDRKLSPVPQFLFFFCILGLWWGSLTSTLRVTTLRKWLNHRYFWFFDDLFIHILYAREQLYNVAAPFTGWPTCSWGRCTRKVPKIGSVFQWYYWYLCIFTFTVLLKKWRMWIWVTFSWNQELT